MQRGKLARYGRWTCRLLAALAAAACLPAQGATSYYVDPGIGDDAWSGRSASVAGSDGPWRSLRRVGAAALAPGDTVHLRCGGVWREPLVLTRSGAADLPVSVKPYGEDCAASNAPLVDPVVPLSGWRDAGGGVHAARVDFEVADLYVDGEYLPPARYPREGWLRAAQSVGAWGLTVDDPTLQSLSGRELSGAELRVRSQDWLIEARSIVEAKSGGQLSFDRKTEFPVRAGARYYLQGLPWMLSYPGGWAHDADAGEVRVRLAGDASPDDHSIETPGSAHGLVIRGAGYVVVEGLRVRRAGVAVTRSYEITLRALRVLDSGQDGISIEDSQAVRVLDSTVEGSQANGIAAVRSSGIAVQGTTVADSSMKGRPVHSPAAINLGRSSGVHVEGNTVRNSGYVGIRFKRRAKILNNTVTDSCQVLDDCGAIYAWADNDPDPALNSEVVGNVIDGTRPSDADTPYPSYASGIYLDDLTNGVTVSGNTVTRTDSGVHLHNTYDLLVQGNTLKNNRRNQVYLSMGHPRVRGDRLSNNRFSANTLEYDATSLGVEIRTDYPQVRHAEFDADQYIASSNLAVTYEAPRPGMEDRLLPRIYDLQRWRSERGQEAGGTYKALGRAEPADYPAILVAADFSRDGQGWNAWSPDGRATLKWQSACANGNQGCLILDPVSGVALAISKGVSAGAGRRCELRIRARSDDKDNPIQVRFRRNKPPFSSAGLTAQGLVGNAWSDLVFRFQTSKDWKGQGQIELKATGARPVQLAGVRLDCR